MPASAEDSVAAERLPATEAAGTVVEFTPPQRSAEAHEFLGRAPHWMLRSGLAAVVALLVVLVVLGAVIRYPDTIEGRMTITGMQPVGEVVARQGGRLEALRVKEGQRVARGEILAIVESPARADAVFRLAGSLKALDPATIGGAPMGDVAFKPEEGLGKLQNAYAAFLNSYNQLRSVVADDYAEKAGALLRQQREGKRGQTNSLREQGVVSRRELKLAQEKFGRMKALHAQKLLSAAQLQEEEIAMLEKMRAETTAQRAFTAAEIEAAEVAKSIHDLEHERSEMLRKGREQVGADFNRLRGELDVWEADYVLRAPADGTVAFYEFWSDQQFVAAGRQVFLIVPETTQLIGRMPVSQGGVGKIRAGQVVQVRLDDFPYKEFGLVMGRVQSVSMVAREGAHLVLVDLPMPLVTTFRRRIDFRQEMAGRGSVVTEDLRLIERVLYEIRRAFVNNTAE